MNPNLYMKNGCFTKDPLKNGFFLGVPGIYTHISPSWCWTSRSFVANLPGKCSCLVQEWPVYLERHKESGSWACFDLSLSKGHVPSLPRGNSSGFFFFAKNPAWPWPRGFFLGWKKLRFFFWIQFARFVDWTNISTGWILFVVFEGIYEQSWTDDKDLVLHAEFINRLIYVLPSWCIFKKDHFCCRCFAKDLEGLLSINIQGHQNDKTSNMFELGGSGLKYFIFTPPWGDDPIWRIFFRWVETTNQLNDVRSLPWSKELLQKDMPGHRCEQAAW